MNGWYDDFDTLYDLYDNDEPTLYVENYMYCFQHYPTESNERQIHVTLTDLSQIPEDANIYSQEFEIATFEFENTFKLFHEFVLVNGKTIAQMMCDANCWDYSILPVYPKWLTLLGAMNVQE